jgi:DNA-binding transcriptional LysR family regulator
MIISHQLFKRGAQEVNIDHLREFNHLAETLSFSSTAKYFYMSQSVLSKHIAAIEDELGLKLFVRDSHHVHLTKCGQAFHQETQILINDYEKAVAHAIAIDRSFLSTIRIGYLRNASRPFIGNFLKLIGQKYPEHNVIATCMEFGESYNALNLKKIDIAFTLDLDDTIHEKCDIVPIYDDAFVVVVAPDSPLAQQDSITQEQLKTCDLIVPDPDGYPGMARFIDQFIPQDHSGKRLLYRDIDTMFMDVQIGKGLAFTSNHQYPVFGSTVKFLPIEDLDTSYRVSAMTLKGADTEILKPVFEILDIVRKKVPKNFFKAEFL